MRDQCNHCAVKICLIYFTLHCHDHHKKREQILTYHHHLIHTVSRWCRTQCIGNIGVYIGGNIDKISTLEILLRNKSCGFETGADEESRESQPAESKYQPVVGFDFGILV